MSQRRLFLYYKCICAFLYFVVVPAIAQEPADKPKDVPLAPTAITVDARVIANFTPVSMSGRLSFMGGLDLSSKAKGFGGFSALALDAFGKQALAISDGGLWLRFALVTDNDAPKGIGKAVLGPLLGANSKSLAGSPKGDAESVAVVGDNAYIGFEQTDAIWRYALTDGAPQNHALPFDFPDEIKALRYSRGLESLAAFPKSSRYPNALLAIGESPVRGEEHNRGWIIARPSQSARASANGGIDSANGANSNGKDFRRFTVIARDGYAITDAAFLSNGNLVLLERRFVPPFGIAMRLREIQGRDISGGARLDGEVLMEARLGAPIDNMEGLAVSKGEDGADILTLIADNNFNAFQRTLLLRFKYKE